MQFIDEVVDIPVAALRQIHMNRNVQKTMEIHQLRFTDKVSDVLAVLVVQVPQVQVVVKTVQIPQLPFGEHRCDPREPDGPGHSDLRESEHCVCPPTQAEMVDVENGRLLLENPHHPRPSPVVKCFITDLANMLCSVLDGINKLSHDISKWCARWQGRS